MDATARFHHDAGRGGGGVFGGDRVTVRAHDPAHVGGSERSYASSLLDKAARLRIGGRLFFKYIAIFFAVVLVALLSNGAAEVYFSYQEHKASLIRIQHEQAEAAAGKIGQFIKEIEA